VSENKECPKTHCPKTVILISYLASVAVDVEGFVHGNDPHGGFLALVWHNRLMADAAPRGKLPVMKKNSLLKDEVMLKVLYSPKYLSNLQETTLTIGS